MMLGSTINLSIARGMIVLLIRLPEMAFHKTKVLLNRMILSAASLLKRIDFAQNKLSCLIELHEKAITLATPSSKFPRLMTAKITPIFSAQYRKLVI